MMSPEQGNPLFQQLLARQVPEGPSGQAGTPPQGGGAPQGPPPSPAQGMWSQPPPPKAPPPGQGGGMPPQAQGMPPMQGGGGVPPSPPPNPSPRIPPATERWSNAQQMSKAYANNWNPNPVLLRAMLGR